jgi:hypothetical protein
MHSTADRIIYASLAAILLMGLVSFWANPAYEKGVGIAMGAAGAALSGALGFKFGVSNADAPRPPSP